MQMGGLKDVSVNCHRDQLCYTSCELPYSYAYSQSSELPDKAVRKGQPNHHYNKSFVDWVRSSATRCWPQPSLPGCCIMPNGSYIKGESYRLKEKRRAGFLGDHIRPRR